MGARGHGKLAIAALLLLISVSWSAALAQFVNSDGVTLHGVPPSVTSFGFGGIPGPHGVPPSVTSPGFGSLPFISNQRPFEFRHHHHGSASFYGGGYPYYYAPYAYDPYGYPLDVMEPGVDDSMEEEYRGGPTIFDRRGYGAPDYSKPPARQREEDYRGDVRKESESAPPEQAPAPEPPADQPSTVLVFKDGHRLEVSNYAIVGGTLYDIGGGRTHKVALAELDLASTVKQNSDRGVEFRLPDGVKSN
jgi:hypothetical protein